VPRRGWRAALGPARRPRPGPPGHRGGGGMLGVDVRLNDLNPVCVQPADERPGGLGGVSPPLPPQADDPRDLGPPPLAGDRRLDIANDLSTEKAQDPVTPFLAAVRSPAARRPG